jgi:DNA-binding NarL/FixJ family response regulator
VHILIVDDNPRFRAMVKQLIAGRTREETIIRECADGDEALTTYLRERPHWVVMDIELGHTDGLTATRAILQQDPSANIIVVTQYTEPAYRQAAQEAGARAFLLKEDLSGLPALFAMQ